LGKSSLAKFLTTKKDFPKDLDSFVSALQKKLRRPLKK